MPCFADEMVGCDELIGALLDFYKILSDEIFKDQRMNSWGFRVRPQS
jgi:hypothetical protein